MQPGGFFVLRVGANVADVRVSEGDNLAAVGWVGGDFLITRERCIEHHFTHLRGGGAKRNALEYCAVCEREQGARVGACD